MADASAREASYAAAILEVARAEGVIERVTDELFRFARTLETSDPLRQALTDTATPIEKRQAIAEDLVGRRAHPATANAVAFLLGAGLGRRIPEVADALVKKAAAERQREVAEVRTAIPLDADQIERLTRALSDTLGKQVEVKVLVDPTVLGGVVARVGDTVIDGTVRHRLDQLREAL